MVEIRAFVGHSFTNDDAEVVGKFLTYFTKLSDLDLNFSWQHAEAAEPSDLADKVMSLLSDKNVFIGICTKKERVIPDTSLSKAFFSSSILKAREKEFSWKTSDWIVQEIGLAIGKNLDLILLLENDVRRPGGLQGNVEYIPFDRNFPDKSFVKVLEMIKALSPKAVSASTQPPDTKTMPAEEEKDREKPEDDLGMTPQPTWKRVDYEIAYWEMIWRKDTVGIESINQAYLETDDAVRDDNQISWQAFTEISRLRWGEGGSLVKLKTLVNDHPDSSKTLECLANGYLEYHDFANAAKTFEEAASKATDEREALHLLGRAAVEYERAEEPATALAIINRMKISVEESGKGELQILMMLKNLTKLKKEDVTYLAIMERFVEIDPSDISTRFSLAYKHSECGNNDLALLHYLEIPYRERKQTTWNNLGVEFDQFSLPAKTVDAYRKAEEMGETLAMSNLALKFISAGFLPEAQKQCDNALAINNFHKNVGHTFTMLKDLPGEEDKKETELLKKAKPKSDFYKKFGRAASRSDPRELYERWEGPDCVLDVTLHSGAFRAVGSYKRPSTGMLPAGAFGLVGGTISKKKSPSFRVEYSGTLRGHAIEAHVTRIQEDATPKRSTLLGSSTNEIKVLMVLSEDKTEFKVMECPVGIDSRFYKLKHQPINAPSGS